MLTLIAAQPNKEFDRSPTHGRGDLVNRVHADGRVGATEHTADGTRIKARGAASAGGEPTRVLDVLGEVADLVGRSGHHSLRQLGFQFV
jgi:hypothetical protein